MANTANDVLRAAKGQLGTVGGSKYTKWYYGKVQNVSWCAIFVSWCMAQAGVPASVCPKFALVINGRNWFKKQGRFRARGSYTPKPGDVIFFNWGASATSSSNNHVGIVSGCSGGKVTTIEGNTSSPKQVKSHTFNLSYSCIIGYGVPAYNGSGSSGSGSTTTSTTTTPAVTLVHRPAVYTDYDSDTTGVQVDDYRLLWYSLQTKVMTDITARAGDLSLRDDIDCIYTELSFNFVQSTTDKHFPWRGIGCGDRIVLQNHGKTIYSGHINKISGSYRDSMSVTCYDDGQILNFNDVIIQFNGVSAKNAIYLLCKKLGITHADIPNLATVIKKIYKDSAANILEDILNSVTAENGTHYFCRVFEGCLTIKSYGKTPIDAYHKPAGNLSAFKVQNEISSPNVSWGIDDLKNYVVIYSEQDEAVTVMGVAGDQTSISKFGRRMKIDTYTDSDTVSATQKAKTTLKDLNKITQDITLSCYGSDKVVGGCVLTFNEPEFFGNFLVKSVTHHYGYPHTMDLTLERA